MADFQDPRKGLRIELPDVFIPWGISEEHLLAMFGGGLRKITDGYFTIECTALTGLRLMLGFHFQPRVDGRLIEFEFFRISYPGLTDSFKEFQNHLGLTFGIPVEANSDSCVWHFDDVELRHYIIDRFGPEEQLRLKWTAASPLSRTPKSNSALN